MPQHWQMRRDLVNALLDALPASRQVAVRTPGYKVELLQDDQPISEAQAFSDQPIARISHHNDCFVSSPDDYGTYNDTAVEKPYLAADSRYTLVSGETCNPYPPISDCPNSVREMSRFHWTCLNRDYNTSLLNGWIQQGCFDEVQKKLGYRFRMISADIQESAKPGGGFHLGMKLINEGWAGLINPRDVEVVIRNLSTGEEYFYPVEQDPRRWPLGDTLALTVDPGIPYDLPLGEYSVYFRMPDPEPTISSNPAYSIRMANIGTWESSSGLNSLQASFQVAENPALPAYQGTGMFQPVKKNIIEDPSIVIDGLAVDWQGIEPKFTAPLQPARAISYFNTADSLYFLVTGTGMQSSCQLFIDADNNPLTGYAAWQWQGNGSDYLVENGLFYRFSGAAHEWAWTQAGSVTAAINDTVQEMGIAWDQLNGVLPGDAISFAYVNDPQNVVQACYLPLMNNYFINTENYLESPGQIRVKSFQDNALIYWTGTADEEQYNVVQRARGDEDFETVRVFRNDVFAFTDEDLDENTGYSYRIYRMAGDRLSPAGATAQVTTAAAGAEFLNISLTSPPDDWKRVIPAATADKNDLTGLLMVNFGDSLFFSFEGPEKENYTLYLNPDRNNQTGLVSPLNGKSGYDYLIRNDSLYSVAGQAWSFSKKISSHDAPGFYTAGLKLAEAGLGATGTALISGSINNKLLPDFMPEGTFNLLPAPGIPGYFLVRNSQTNPDTRIIVEWSIPSDCEGYILERSVGDSSHFEVLATLPRTSVYYHDNSVSPDTAYYYRMYSYFTLNRSPYTAILGGYPGTLTFGLGEVSFNAASVRVIPNPFSSEAKVEIFSPYSQQVEVMLLDNLGKEVKKIYTGEATGYTYITLRQEELPAGLYFLRITGDRINSVQKLIIN
jgi:hypothetical protein